MTDSTWLITGPLGKAIGWTLVHSFWQLTIVAAGLALLLRFVSPKRPELRYNLLLAGLMVGTLWVGYTFIQIWETAASGMNAAEPGGWLETIIIAPTEKTAPQSAGSLRQELWAHIQQLDPHTPAITIGWFIGVLLFSLYLIAGLLYLKYVQHRKVRHPLPKWKDKLADLCRRMGIKKKVSLYLSEIVEEPITFQLFRPVILLPATLMTGLTPAQIEVLLIHELAHIRRYDFAVNLLQTLVEVLFFFHPAVWWLSGKIREEREFCCDRAVMAVQNEPFVYVEALTRIQSFRFSSKKNLAMSANGNQSSLSKRVFRLLGRYDQEPSRYNSILVICLLLLIGFTGQAFFTVEASSGNAASVASTETLMTTPEAPTSETGPAQEMPFEAETSVVKGTVYDAERSPLIGAVVAIKDTKVGTITDFSGNFEIRIPEKCATLVIKYVGMESREMENSCAGENLEIVLQKAANDTPFRENRKETLVPNTSDTEAYSIKGKVVSEEGPPLIGVNILIKGTTTGTISDLEGDFHLRAPGGCVDLVFTYVGRKAVEVSAICAERQLGIVMEKATGAADNSAVVPQRSRAEVQSASDLVVKGKVLDKDAQPLIGANIIVKGTATGTVTDFDGNFRLRLPAGCPTLLFSYVGMTSKEWENACERDNLLVILHPEKSDPTPADELLAPVIEKLDSQPTPDLPISAFKSFPNPAKEAVNISFQLATANRVKLSVYSVDGKLIQTIVDEKLEAGPQQFSWNPGELKGSFSLLLEIAEGIARTQIVIE